MSAHLYIHGEHRCVPLEISTTGATVCLHVRTEKFSIHAPLRPASRRTRQRTRTPSLARLGSLPPRGARRAAAKVPGTCALAAARGKSEVPVTCGSFLFGGDGASWRLFVCLFCLFPTSTDELPTTVDASSVFHHPSSRTGPRLQAADARNQW